MRLLPWHDIKAYNGIVWKHKETYLTEKAGKCSYVGPQDQPDRSNYAIPTRGNCKECGANGPLSQMCVNECAYTPKNLMVRDKEIEEDYPFMMKWMYDRCDYGYGFYQLMITPDKKGIVDAEFFLEACAKGPETDVERHVMSFMEQKYKIRAKVDCGLMRSSYIPRQYEKLMEDTTCTFQLKEDDNVEENCQAMRGKRIWTSDQPQEKCSSYSRLEYLWTTIRSRWKDNIAGVC